MKNETEYVEKKEASTKLLFDESLDGYYTVKSATVRITEKPDQKKTDFTIPILFNGENVKCDGHYTIAGGKRYLFVESSEKTGYVLEGSLTKL